MSAIKLIILTVLLLGINCGDNEVYEIRDRPSCQPRCGDPQPNITSCDINSQAACYCAEGYLMSGEECVLPDDCGCEYEGAYYNVSNMGSEFITISFRIFSRSQHGSGASSDDALY